MSHNIHMLSIQIGTKSHELVIHYQFNNIKLSFFASHMKRSFPLFIRCSKVIRYPRGPPYFICISQKAQLVRKSGLYQVFLLFYSFMRKLEPKKKLLEKVGHPCAIYQDYAKKPK